MDSTSKTNPLPSSILEPMKPARRRYFTIPQIANRWGVSSPTVIRLIDEGHLTGLKIHGVYRVNRESIDAYERKVVFSGKLGYPFLRQIPVKIGFINGGVNGGRRHLGFAGLCS